MEMINGFTTLSPMAVTPPMSSPVAEHDSSLHLSFQLPTPPAPATPEGYPDRSTEENTPTGSWQLKLGVPLEESFQPSTSPIPSFLEGSILGVAEFNALIAGKSQTEDSRSLSVPAVEPPLKSKQSPVKSTCSTSLSTFKERPLSPRSRMRLWASKRPLTNPGLEPVVPVTVQAPQKGTKMSATMAKARYSALLMEMAIVNSQQYEERLRESEELRALERMVQPNQIESTKKLIFRQNFLLRSQTYVAKFEELSDPTVTVSSSLRGGWLSFLDQIARRNAISREHLMVCLRRWIMNSNGKKKGLILIGRSDSGKTFLADCLLSVFDKSDIGYFQCPMGQNVSTFMYANLLNKEAYRCDEFILEHAGVLQSFKQLTEGSSTLQTDVKYKDSTHVDPKPVVVTMNGDAREDVVKWFSTEFTTLQNRCLILLMDMRLKDMYTNKQLDQLRAGADVLLRLLFTTYIDVVDKNELSLSEYDAYI